MKLNPPNFLAILEEVIEEEDKNYVSKPYEYRHNPSSSTMKRADGKIIGACLRQLWMKAKAFPVSNPKEFKTKLQAGFGNAIHTWVLEKLQKSKRLAVIPEAPGKVSIDPLTRQVSFRLDGLVTHKGELGVFELKTQQGFGLLKMLRDNNNLPAPKDILQVLDYFGTNPAIMWGALVYLGRDSGLRAEYHIWKDDEGKWMIKGLIPHVSPTPIDELTFEKVVDRWKELEGFIDRDEMPPRDYKVVYRAGVIVPHMVKNGTKYKSDFNCIYCSYKDACWSLPGSEEDRYVVRGAKKVEVEAQPLQIGDEFAFNDPEGMGQS